MSKHVRTAIWRTLGSLLLLTLLVGNMIILVPTQKAYADHTLGPECIGITTPCIDVHTTPRGYYYGTIYVDGYNFTPNAYIAVVYNNRYVPNGAESNGSGQFTVTIPPGCYYGAVRVTAHCIFSEQCNDVSNEDTVYQIC